jgi:hypothetical protein
MTEMSLVSYINNNILAILWIWLFLKNKRENTLKIVHILFLVFAFAIICNSLYNISKYFIP